MNIVLLEPEIPMNTGNIGRTCVATGSRLHLIKPLGFDTDEAAVKRAGLDYWRDLDISYYENFDDFLARNALTAGDRRVYMATTKAKLLYTSVAYETDAFVVFGKESAGIPEELLLKFQQTCVRIPMNGEYRSLNLANSVAVIVYEALRQRGFEGMNAEGRLHRLEWN
jgi:tRNA (cytidine/uridine-2'-O-)-methyltransferase